MVHSPLHLLYLYCLTKYIVLTDKITSASETNKSTQFVLSVNQYIMNSMNGCSGIDVL